MFWIGFLSHCLCSVSLKVSWPNRWSMLKLLHVLPLLLAELIPVIFPTCILLQLHSCELLFANNNDNLKGKKGKVCSFTIECCIQKNSRHCISLHLLTAQWINQKWQKQLLVTTFKLIHRYLTQVVSISSHFASKYSQFYAGHILSIVLRMSPVEGTGVLYLCAVDWNNEAWEKTNRFLYFKASVKSHWPNCQSSTSPPPAHPFSCISRWCVNAFTSLWAISRRQ